MGVQTRYARRSETTSRQGVNPDCAGTTAELYEGQELPEVLVDLMTDTPWCDEVQEYVPMDDPARVHLVPEAESCELQNPMTCATI